MSNCSICGSGEASREATLNCGNLMPSSLYPVAKVVSCNHCGHVYNDLSAEEQAGLIKYYQDEYSAYNVGSPNKTGDIPGSKNPNSLVRYSELFEVVSPYIRSSDAILDIGCAAGGFLEYLKDKGFENLYGTDLCDNFIVEARKKMGITIRQGTAEVVPYNTEKFNFITSDQVVEHLVDPNKIFSEASRLLNLGGYFCVSVPDTSLYHEHLFFPQFWFLIREHVQHFDNIHLMSLALKHGFKLCAEHQAASSMFSKIVKLPRLTMIFQYTGESGGEIICDHTIRGDIAEYKSKSVLTASYARSFDDIRKAQEPVYVYGMSREFLWMHENGAFNGIKVIDYLDDTPAKKGKLVGDRPVVSSDVLKGAKRAPVVITALAHVEELGNRVTDLGHSIARISI